MREDGIKTRVAMAALIGAAVALIAWAVVGFWEAARQDDGRGDSWDG